MTKEFILKELEVFNDIQFEEENHKYYKGDYKFPISSTSWVKKFKEPFNEDYWAGRKAKERGVSKEVILEEWETNRRYSTDVLGTPLHRYMECKLSGIEVDIEPANDDLNKLLLMADNFLYKSKDYMTPIKSEVVIGDIEIEIAGMVDQLYINNQTGLIEMWDWKTSKEIELASFNDKRMKFPFIDYKDANLYHYSLQLNLYKYIIEKYTKIEISRMRICQFSILNETYKIYNCLNMQSELRSYFTNLI